jgi:hypothetical protein
MRIVSVEMNADDYNYVLLCKFPDKHSRGRVGYNSTTIDTTTAGDEMSVAVKLAPGVDVDVYSSLSLLNFCKKDVDQTIVDAVLLTQTAISEFNMIGNRPADIALGILLLPVICCAAAVAVQSGDTGMCDCFRKNMWRWKDKQVEESKKKGTYVECKFVAEPTKE